MSTVIGNLKNRQGGVDLQLQSGLLLGVQRRTTLSLRGLSFKKETGCPNLRKDALVNWASSPRVGSAL